jgi:hypothetical protein
MLIRIRTPSECPRDIEKFPAVSYRRIKGVAEQHNRKMLKCPTCSARVTDMDEGTRVELFGHSKHVQMKCDIYLHCNNSHGEVGIRFRP